MADITWLSHVVQICPQPCWAKLLGLYCRQAALFEIPSAKRGQTLKSHFSLTLLLLLLLLNGDVATSTLVWRHRRERRRRRREEFCQRWKRINFFTAANSDRARERGKKRKKKERKNGRLSNFMPCLPACLKRNQAREIDSVSTSNYKNFDSFPSHRYLLSSNDWLLWILNSYYLIDTYLRDYVL